MIKKLSKSQSRAFRFVNNARSKDSARPNLNTIKFEKDYMVACDGFRIHAIKCQSEDLPGEGLYELDSGTIPAEGYVEIEKSELDPSTYPKYALIFPQTEPVAIIRINARFLIDAISRSSKSTKITIKYYAENLAVEVFTKDDCDVPAYALIMPMHLDGVQEYWRPSLDKEEIDEPA